MAKLVLTLALFLLFSLSRSQSDPNPSDDLLLLPSDNPRDDLPDDSASSAAVADPNPAIEDPQPNRDAFVTLPLTKLDFHEGNMPLSLRFPHRRHFGRGCRHGRLRMHPRQFSYGNDMILSDGKDASQEFHRANRRPGFEASVPWKGGEESLFQRPEELEHGGDEEDEEKMFKRPMKFKYGRHHHHHHDDDDDDVDEMFKRPKKFRHHDDDEDDVFKRHKKLDHDDEFSVLETVSKVKHDDKGHVLRMSRKFKHHDDDQKDWHREMKHHRRRFGRSHHKHHHDDDDEDDNKGGIFSKMRKFFDDLF